MLRTFRVINPKLFGPTNQQTNIAIIVSIPSMPSIRCCSRLMLTSLLLFYLAVATSSEISEKKRGKDYYGAIPSTVEQLFGKKQADKILRLEQEARNPKLVRAYADLLSKVLRERSVRRAIASLGVRVLNVDQIDVDKSDEKSSEESSEESEEYLY